jgi:hypothetical protein
MTNLSLLVIAFLATGGHAGPSKPADFPTRIEQVRMVCDQYCNCWRTRYQGRQTTPTEREDLACRNRSPDPVYYYNGYYRHGPATGLGFESRSPVREFSFPF